MDGETVRRHDRRRYILDEHDRDRERKREGEREMGGVDRQKVIQLS